MHYSPFMGMYNATKAALIHVTKQLALELSPRVRVNAICPGVVRTRLAEALWKEHEQAVSTSTALGRIGEPVDIAGAVTFLVSDAASWITGEAMVIDGGQVLGNALGFRRADPVTSAQLIGIDPAAVAGWIERLGIGFSGPLTFERIGLGQSNLTYRVRDADGRSWVLRRPPLGTLLASAHDVGREARILSALQGTAVPAPRVYGLTRDEADVPLLLMEYVEGLVVDRMSIAEALTPQQRRQIGLSLPKTLAKIHDVDIDEVGLSDLASHKPYAQRQLKRWAGQWELSKTPGFARPRRFDPPVDRRCAAASGVDVGAR